MSSSVGEIEPETDLRHYWVGVRDQGMRSSCLACSTSDCHAYAHGLGDPLSVEHLFYRASKRMPGGNSSTGLTFDAMTDTLKRDGQCAESHWPYSQTQPSPWAPPDGITDLWRGDTSFTKLGASAALVSLLQGGTPVILAVRMRESFHDVAAPHYTIADGGAYLGAHAVVAAGFGKDSAGGVQILIRNSWGFQWGFGGYAWLPASYIESNLLGFSSVRAIQS
ncbi:Papain family cysteine protease [Variovorax sp. YR750]|uniref:C1 family peptidase n=1 Tax=Variovorax sp. YR750 TaxID=1884384 RepID=UPI0008D8C399|nr:C1 family peptidase [Variovorax sp. YR750]SEM14932.1 Papain family cysteine protease [Variovorax sp. YR750]